MSKPITAYLNPPFRGLGGRSYLGGYSIGVPPLPIPNREVKPNYVDGTARQRGRVDSRRFLIKSAFYSNVKKRFFLL